MLAKSDFSVFNEYCFDFDNNWHHDEWGKILEGKATQVGDEIRWLPRGHYVDNKWIMLEAPRSHAKSTEFSVSYPCFEIGKNQNVRIIVVSSALSQSMSFLREITVNLERNEKYREVFGNLVPVMAEKWTQHEIIVDRTRTNLKDPTVSATSIGGTVLSRRADIIICDDILSDQNTRTAEQREKVRQWFFEVLLPVLEPNGRLIVVGTAWNTEDLYAQLLGDPTFDIRKVYQAIMDENATDPEKQVLWPKRWSYETLMKRKASMGSRAFNKSYQNIVLSAEDAVFKLQWTQAAKARGSGRTLLKKFDYALWDLGRITKAAGMDLAISMRKESDFTAIAVLGRTENGMKIPLWLDQGKWSPAEQRAKIIAVNEAFSPSIIMVENNGYQEALRRDVADTTDLPVRGYTTGGEKFDEDVGVNSLAVEFENNKWILPYPARTDESELAVHTRKMIDLLVDGLLAFRSGVHTADILMAVWFANTGLRTINSGEKVSVSVKKKSIYRKRRR